MNGNIFRIVLLVVMVVMLAAVGAAYANKSAVEIIAPASVAKGGEAVVKLQVTHSANNFLHYTNWLKVTANGKEVGKWEFSWLSRPESNNFTREIKLVVTEPVKLWAEANCNIHGSNGPATATIAVVNQ